MTLAYVHLDKLISPDNWTFCHYKLAKNKCQISMGADPEDDSEIYFVSVLNSEDRDIFQKEFRTLQEACQYINQNYSDWSFSNQVTKEKDGCSTCAAH